MNIKVVSIIILFIAFLSLLLWQGFSSGSSLVYTPTELLAEGRDFGRVRVAGKVAAGKVSYQIEPEFLLEFQIKNPGELASAAAGSKLQVSYQGIKPDMFAENRDVIIDGEYKDNVLIAKNLLTQCPSKYEPPKPTEESTEGVTEESSASPKEETAEEGSKELSEVTPAESVNN